MNYIKHYTRMSEYNYLLPTINVFELIHEYSGLHQYACKITVE